MSEILFPADFLWGAATSSAQIEGAWDEDGKTPHIWDIAPGHKIKNAHNCRVSCDHYHRYKEDIARMKEIGLNSYRFSVSWSRIMPAKGVINECGIKFYSDLVDELLSAGIEPIVTIFHWDLPVWVQELGGWESDALIPLFADYTKAVTDALSDRVSYWIPMNEPQCFIMNGHVIGNHAPFFRKPLKISKYTRVCLLAHAEAVRTIRQYALKPPKIGIAMAAGAFIPKNDSEKAIEKARKRTFGKGLGLMANRWWSDPILAGKPVRAFGIFRSRKEDVEKSFQKLDFVGINFYQPYLGGLLTKKQNKLPQSNRTVMGWPIDARGLYWTIRFFHERYGIDIMITENGMAHNDTVENGKVSDDKRIGFIRDHLIAVKKALTEKIPVIGYQYWSLFDNFEWADGYDPRFGLIHIDYETQKRTFKDSAYYYRSVIGSRGAEI